MEIVIAVATKIAEYTVEPIGRQLGYLFFYNRNVTELKKQVESLEDTKLRVQRCIDEATRKGDEIHDDVMKWLTSVDGIKEEADKLGDVKKSTDEDARQEVADMSCSYWSCLNLKLRYQRSRKAYKTTELVPELESKGRLFEGRVSYRVAPQGIGTEAVKGYEVFDSRNSTLSGVLEALKSDNVSKIGVYGMGGVGKTMLVKEVARLSKQDKLFDKVVMAVVSQTPNEEEIQDKIAYVLDLKFDAEATRADKLREQLKREKSILVIIDDIWEVLKLDDVGISFGDDQKGCKLLFTSRSKRVLLGYMDSPEIFTLGILSNDEARYLFEKIVGGLPEDTNFHSVADEVVKECAGLPLAITVIANALKKDKSLHVWKDALLQLQTSNPATIEGVSKELYSTIEFSYKFLTSEQAKLFLLCSLFEEDSDIDVEFLLRYGMGLDLFQGVYYLDDVRNRMHTLVGNLKSSSLLLESDENDTVRMHDVIRDVAIHIAAKDKRMFNVGNEVKFLEWSKQKKLKDSTAISLSCTNVFELPERLECPQLTLFLLFNKNCSSQIPHPFFEGTKELRVLHLIGMDSLYFSSSLSFFKNLQTLCLNDCSLENIAFIGELENLKVLSLSDSDIKELPKEISQLTNLQVLDLSKCYELQIIPANVLSSLKRLEELYMENSFKEWEVEGESTEGSIARVKELDRLSHLATLNICIPSAEFLSKGLILKKLVRYKICIGDDVNVWDDDSKFKTSKTLLISKLSLQSKNLDAVKILLKSCEDLHLLELEGFQNVFYESSSDGFPQLKHLQVEDNDEFQFVIKGHRCVAFPTLESFSLVGMTNLEKICHGQLAVGSFNNLRKVEVEYCGNLKFVFSSSMAGCFPKLQEMVIIGCKVMSTIIAMEREDEPEIIDSTKDMMEFTQLQSLTLDNLPNLKCFHSNVDSRLLFNEKVSFKNLTTLTVQSCGSLKYLLSSSTARSLVQLKDLGIYKCKFIEEILATESSEEKRTNIILFPKLESLYLWDLPKLMRFCFENLIEFPSLKTLGIADCPELKTFVSNSLSTNLTINRELEEMDNFATQSLFNEKVSFKNLTTLDVQSFGSLKYLLLSSTARSLVQLKDLKIYKCEVMEEILITEESGEEKRTDNIWFPKLESLDLWNLSKLMRFCSENLIEFPSLKTLKITDCPELKTFVYNSLSANLTVNNKLEELNNCAVQPFFNEKVSFKNLTTLIVRSCSSLKYLLSSSTARSLVQLKDLEIYNCEVIEEILATETSEEKRTDNILFVKRGEAGDDEILFNQLESLVLSGLSSLTSFSLGNCNIKFPSLKKVFVVECPKLKIFSHGMLSTPKLQRVCLTKIFIRYYAGERYSKDEWRFDVVVRPTKELGEVNLNATVERFWKDKFNKTEERSFTNQMGETSRDDKEHDMDNES